jgi:hypothetical protein
MTIVTVNTIEGAEGFFDDAAKEALKKTFAKVVGPVTPEYKTLFFSTRVYGEDKLLQAAKAIAEQVNVLASLGKVLGVLAPLSKVKLTQTWTLDGQVVGWEDGSGFVPSSVDLTKPRTPPQGALRDPPNWAVFCFITVPWDFEPAFWADNALLKYLVNEGEVGKLFISEEV